MRPTGRLHIGHYFGALENWVNLQNDSQYECFFFVADWHALTSDYANTYPVAQNTIEIATDWLATGLDPEKCKMFIQSSVPEHAELSLLLSMVTPLSWLERVPTYKEALENIKGKDLHTFGFLGYPVLQTADIVMYGQLDQPLIVPVGEDQVAHLELGREIVHHCNLYFGEFKLNDELRSAKALLSITVDWLQIPTGRIRIDNLPLPDGQWNELKRLVRNRALEIGNSNAQDILRRKIENSSERIALPVFEIIRVLSLPEALLTHSPRIPGTDGRKMSKSYGNFIALSESDESIRTKSRAMITDPARKRRTDPGNPDVCPVYDWHKLFSPSETQVWVVEGCRSAGIGCIECNTAMADNLIPVDHAGSRAA